jgi:tetratricopeptide (TPR) repeat protein
MPRIFLLLIFLTTACSQYSYRRSSVNWHNFNAKYNAYLQAKDNLDIAESTILTQYKDNYAEALPVLIPLDSNSSKVASKEIEAVLKKASLIADKHQNSKYMGAAYNLLGRARLLKGDYLNAIETFKYVNSEATKLNQKHEALTLLMRTYEATNDDATALRVGEIIAQQELNKKNSINFYLVKAQIHQKTGDYKTAAQILNETLPLMKKGPQKARLHFVAGQLFDKVGDTRQAAANYRLVLNNKPNYDLQFYSQLNKMMYSTGSNMKDEFEKMIKDRKNIDLQDKLYYSLALVEEKEGNLDNAIANLEKATKATGQGTQNKSAAYQKLGDIHYFRLQKYEKANAYYDSTLVMLTPTSQEYAEIANRKRALDEFALHKGIINTEDSLQRMAKMDSATLDVFLKENITKQLKQEAKAIQDAQKANEALKKQQAQNTSTTMAGDPNKRWYFYNENMLMTGRIEFTQRWGQRKLEDHWRRQTKDMIMFINNDSEQKKADSSLVTNEIDEEQIEEKIKNIKSKIPKTAAELEQSVTRQAMAYFNIGKVYHLFLLEKDNAKKSFLKMLEIKPNLEQVPEAMYYLALIGQGTDQYEYWKTQMNTKYSDSFYTRKLNRGNENLSKNEENKAAEAYNEAYLAYTEGRYGQSQDIVANALKNYPGSNIEDKFAFLKILILGKLKDKENYTLAIDNFVAMYVKSDLMALAKEMKNTMNNVETNKQP